MQGYGRRSAEGNQKQTNYSFEGKLSRSQHWFDLDLDWIETRFNAMEPEFSGISFNKNISGQYYSEVLVLSVIIGY